MSHLHSEDRIPPVPLEEGYLVDIKPRTLSSPGWLSLKEAARHAGVSLDTLRRRINDGQLRAYYVGRSHMVRLRLEDVDALMRPVPTVATIRRAHA